MRTPNIDEGNCVPLTLPALAIWHIFSYVVCEKYRVSGGVWGEALPYQDP